MWDSNLGLSSLDHPFPSPETSAGAQPLQPQRLVPNRDPLADALLVDASAGLEGWLPGPPERDLAGDSAATLAVSAGVFRLAERRQVKEVHLRSRSPAVRGLAWFGWIRHFCPVDMN